MADPVKAEEEKQDSKAQERIKELDRRNKELEKLVNMKTRIDNIESAVDRAARIQEEASRKSEAPVDDGGWNTFLGPKVDPLIEKHLGPIKKAILHLADENDHLRTLTTTPKYRDPEIQAEVENIRRQRQKDTGLLEPRSNIITFLKGQNPEKFTEDKEMENRREDSASVHVETNAGVSGSRADSRASNRSAEDMTIEELEKWMVDNQYKIP